MDPASYPTPKALLEALTRKASGGKDRWTRLERKDGARLVTLDASEPDPGFGFKMALRDTGEDHPKVFVAEVWPGSSAAKAGFGRGDQVLRVGESADFLEKDHGLTPAGAAVLVVELASAPLKPGATCLAEDDLGHPMGDPAEASTAAALRWIQHGTSARGPIPPRGTGSALP